MSCRIAVSGKGGTGKTTLCALLIAYLLRHGRKPVLAVDADPNSNLGEALGVDSSGMDVISTDILDEIRHVAPGTKEIFLESRIHETLIESNGFDLLVMGRPEGSGCYCYVNSLIKKYVEILEKNYPYVVIDNEAGMEHLSRRTTEDVDLLLVVSDPTVKGLRSAKRISELVDELRIGVRQTALILNKATVKEVEKLLPVVRSLGMSLTGSLPPDEAISAFDLEGRPLVELEPSGAAVGMSEKIFGSLLDHGKEWRCQPKSSMAS